MSDDDEYAPDYANEEPEPADEDAVADTDVEEAAGAPAESEEEPEVGLEEDAAGTDLDSEEEPPLEEEAAAEMSDAEAAEKLPHAAEEKAPEVVTQRPKAETARQVPLHRGQPARAEKPRVDPLIRASNKPRIVRIIYPDDRRTSNVLQKSEVAHLLGMRAEQIAASATFFVEAGELHDPGAIAYKELIERRCPLVVRREVGTDPADGALLIEEWFPNEMAHPQIVPPIQLGAARQT